MKKKLFVGAAVLTSVLALASCKSEKTDYNTTRSDKDIDTTLATSVGWVNETTGVKLDSSEKTGLDYVDIYVSKDTVSSLFVYSYDMNDYFATEGAQRNLTATYSALYFSNMTIYSEEQNAILTAVYAETNGAKDKLSGVPFEVVSGSDGSKTIDTTYAYQQYKNNKKISLSVVYLPVYAVHNYGEKKATTTQKVLMTNMLMPVYATFVTDGGEEVTKDGLKASTIASIRTIDLSDYLKNVETFGTINPTKA